MKKYALIMRKTRTFDGATHIIAVEYYRWKWLAQLVQLFTDKPANINYCCTHIYHSEIKELK